jgi:hypothetical protein
MSSGVLVRIGRENLTAVLSRRRFDSLPECTLQGSIALQ